MTLGSADINQTESYKKSSIGQLIKNQQAKGRRKKVQSLIPLDDANLEQFIHQIQERI